LPGRRPNPDGHKGLHASTDRSQVDVETGTADYAPGAQAPGAVQRGRRRYAHRGCEVAIRLSSIRL